VALPAPTVVSPSPAEPAQTVSVVHLPQPSVEGHEAPPHQTPAAPSAATQKKRGNRVWRAITRIVRPAKTDEDGQQPRTDMSSDPAPK